MSGFGSGPFGFLGFGNTLAAPSEATRSSVSSSRLIDGKRKTYVVNDEQGFEAMDDVAQAVLLRIAFAAAEPKFISPEALRKMSTAIRTALNSLTIGPDPAIRIKSIEVTDSGKSSTYKRVVYDNLRTGTLQTVEPT
jgi:hypothetical protein